MDWLEQNANNALEDFPLKAKYFADSFTWFVVYYTYCYNHYTAVCRENTLHDIKHGLNVNHIVTEMVSGRSVNHTIIISASGSRCSYSTEQEVV